MTLAYIDTTLTHATGTASATPTIPDGSIGDLILWVAVWGTPTAASIADRPTLSGGLSASAQHAGSVFGGGGSYALDAGPRGISFWWAIATATTGATDATTFNLTGSGTTRTIGVDAIRISRDQTQTMDVAFTGGEDTTTATSWAPTGFTNVGAAANDLLFTACGVAQDTLNPTVAITWPGCTLGSLVNARTGAVSAGNKARMNVRYAPVTAGTSTGAPTATATTTGMSGVQGTVRLREIAPVGGWQLGSIAMG